MSQLKWLLPIMLSGIFLSTVFADAQRTTFSIENQFPRWEQFEVGASYEGADGKNDDLEGDSSRAEIYLRYGILDNLAVSVDLPYLTYDLPTAASEDGLGDMEVLFQLRTYEDIFGYPYFIPYGSFTLPTGNEDKGLGADGVVFVFGLSYGSTINDWIDWVFDLSYEVNPDTDNRFSLANSYVWNVSKEFGLVTEILYQEAALQGVDSKVLVAAGFTYDWTESLQLDLSLGGGLTGPVDAYGKVKVSYSF